MTATVSTTSVKVLLVEDDEMDQEAIERMISSFDRYPERGVHFDLRIAHSLHEAGQLLRESSVDIALLDLGLSDSDGINTLGKFRRLSEQVAVILLTGRDDYMTTVAAAEAGAQDYLVKGQFTAEGLFRCLVYTYQRLRLQNELTASMDALRASERRMRTLINNNSEGIVLFSEDGSILFLNPAAHNLLGWNVREQIGEFIGLPIVDGRIAELSVVRPGDHPGEITTVEIRIAETQWSGEPAFIGWLRDISAQKRGERYLLDAKLAAENSSRIKTNFLANMSRQIRLPVEEILGLAESLLTDPVIKDAAHPRQHSVHVIRSRAEELVKLLSDLSDLAHLESAGVQIAADRRDVAQLLQQTLANFAEPVRDKKLQLELQLDAPVPAAITVDARRLEQILHHLLDNAVHFTRQGKITLRVGMTTDSRDRPLLRFAVVDTGIGIAPGRLARLFDPFTLVDPTLDEPEAHCGLGLAISQRLAGLMGGEILVRSVVGQGSEFRLIVPLRGEPLTATAQWLRETSADDSVRQPPTAGDLRDSPAKLLKDRNLLVIGQNVAIQQILRFHLEQAGAHVDIAEAREPALSQIEVSLAEGQPYDLILVDQLLESNGLETALWLRQHGNEIPILLTGTGPLAERRRSRDAGVRGVVTKPILREELLSVVREHLTYRR